MADNCVLWVGGLGDKVTEELLYELFLQAGPLDRVTIPKDKDGRNKKFAFINFRHEESVAYTMQLYEGIRLFGQYLRLQTRSGSSSLPSSSSPHNSPSPYSSPQYAPEQRDAYPRDTAHQHGGRSNYHRASSGPNTEQHEPFRSPRDREHGSRPNEPPSRYQRSHTWHGGADKNQDEHGDRHSRHSPQYRPESPQVYQGGSPQYHNDNLESIDVRRQRILQQQNLSLAVHRQDGRQHRDYDRMQPYQRPHSTRRRY
ncbi:RNA-binding protein 7-like [Haliotis cracherodii]|uniref:RNA-binding protein 7-like n=1 Tax=Haliotis cracherodii TaxID=6455 RepID=UPI0039EAED32